MRRWMLGLGIVALVGACGPERTPSLSPDPPTSAQSPTKGPQGEPDLTSVRIELEQVATLEQPLAMAVRPGSSGLYIAQKTGKVVHLRGGSVDPAAVLDLSGQVSLGSEQGLLGLAFSPDGRELFVNYTDTNGDTHVTAFVMNGGRADLSTRREVLFVEQPFVNHNGGNLAFGPDGYLYVGLGDGGSGGDPQGNGQSLSTLLGKMLRIEPRSVEGRGYTVPPTNPFVDRSGARPEIWAFGLRNPWRYTFDRETGDLWIADVGQSAWEEINVQPAASNGGENYGWNLMEGEHPYEGGEPPEGAVRPVFEYSHDDGGCTVTGGYVYRGSAIPELYGAYVFGDYCIGRLEAIRVEGGRVTEHRVLGPVVEGLSSFGEDAEGELYAMSLGGEVSRIVPRS
jgi:glucose/arabinose dehydrogenase